MLLNRLADGQNLSSPETNTAFGAILDGHATEAQTAAFVTALRLRGETPAELAGAVGALRDRMIAIDAPPGAVDVCGTGGDGAHTLNVSTAVAFVVAGAGVPVAKHGNRAASSRAGAADVLTALGVPIEPPIEALPGLLATTNLAFLFAPRHHPGLARVAAIRRELGFRTIFNLLGPLANPARVRRQLIGVGNPAWLALLAEAAAALDADLVWVVHGAGLDELSPHGPSTVIEARPSGLIHSTVTPADAHLAPVPPGSIAGGDAAHNAAALLALLEGAPGPYRTAVLLNAAAALLIAGAAPSLPEGAARAARSLDSGAARAVLRAHQRPAAPPNGE